MCADSVFQVLCEIVLFLISGVKDYFICIYECLVLENI